MAALKIKTENGWVYVTGGNGADVPLVTEEDNGKFCMVVNGAWAAVDVPIAEEASF